MTTAKKNAKKITKATDDKRGRGRPGRTFSGAQRRTIKNCKAKGLTAKQVADKVNTLKITLKEKPVSTAQMVRALSLCDTW